MRILWPVLIALSFSLSTNCLSQEAKVSKVLHGTEALESELDLASTMVDGIDQYLLKQLAATVDKRMNEWPKPTNNASRDVDLYRAATNDLRNELATRVGMIDARTNCERFEFASLVPTSGDSSSAIATNNAGSIYEIQWRVFEGVHGHGLLILPKGEVRFSMVLIPDADQTPEQLCGLTDSSSNIAWEIAARGGVVVIPDTIRRTREARNNRSKMTDQEFIYRSAFVLGRHMLGYQIQEVSAAIDALKKNWGGKPVGVGGWGEGGWIALTAAAIDTRIDGVCVAGHFGPREGVWDEPIHRNVQGLLNRFGDAQLGALIAPRTLVIDAVPGATVRIPGEGGAPAALSGPSADAAKSEFQRAQKLLEPWSLKTAIQYIEPDQSGMTHTSPRIKAIDAMLNALGAIDQSAIVQVEKFQFKHVANLNSEETRRAETLSKWDRFNQVILERCATERDRFWNGLDTANLERFQETVKPYSEVFRKETIGDWEWAPVPFKPRTRLIYEEPKWLGYEVVLDVHDEVFAYGVLLLPRDGKPLKNRPCVVFQHGLEGRPKDTIVGDHPAYHDVSRQLVEQGYIVFAPQHLYLFQDRFRTLQRKSNPLGKTLFSTMVAQHRQLVRWLGGRDEVDPTRIAFYGLSYGGKSAMRIPALVPEYCLSICSADFNDWVWKNASTQSTYSYVWTNEYEIFEFGLGNHFNYAEMAALIAPRPFMVERGHFDAVASDERVALEFAKVKKLYSARLGMGDQCQIEWFVGPHTIHGKGTFEFLKNHLKPSEIR